MAFAADTDERVALVFLSPYDPRESRHWSGTINSIFVALREHDANIRFISGGVLDWTWRAAGKALGLFGVEADLRFSKAFAWLAGAWISARLCVLRADAVVAVAACNYLAFVWTRKPIIYVSDTTFAAIERLYPGFKNFPTWLRRHGRDLEARTLRRVSHVIYPSEWARLSAVEDYGVEVSRIHVMPFGPNLDRRLLAKSRAVKNVDFTNSLRLLYVSADWERKNGGLVLEISRALRSCGLPCELFLVGDIPANVGAEDWVHIVGGLDKSKPADLIRLCELYESAHFFIMPTTADCTPIVFSEAQAFGCPSVTYDVGGTSTAVLDDETGVVLSRAATAADFVGRIEQLVRDPASYQAMSQNARRRYEQSANWEAWAETILQLASRRNFAPRRADEEQRTTTSRVA
jgi:glycosyltransferase involved in cell wall biosynthesis